MKSLYNKLYVIITVIFAIGILFSAYNLYKLPSEFEKASGRLDLTIIKELIPVLNQTYIIIGLTLALGLGSVVIAFYLLNNSKATEKIIYVEKNESQKQDKIEQETSLNKDDLEKQISSIRSGINSIKDQKIKYEKVLSNLCMKLEASQGILYHVQKEKSKRFIELYASFAYNLPDSKTIRYEFGEGLAGQVAKEGKKINIQDVPNGYITIISGLGEASPNHLAILPITKNGEVAYIVEIASFKKISEQDEILIAQTLSLEGESTKPEKKPVGKKPVEKKKVGKSELSNNKKKLDV